MKTAASGLRWAGATFIFVAELGMLVSLAWWGFHTFDGVVQWVLGIGLPVVAAVLWGVLWSPRARVAMPAAVKLTGRTLLLLLGVLLFWAVGQPALAIAQLALVVAGTALTWGWVPGDVGPES